jgi:hypothetical protein
MHGRMEIGAAHDAVYTFGCRHEIVGYTVPESGGKAR